MTVISMIPNDTPFLPPKVTEVPKDVLRNFPHSKKVGNYLLGSTLGEGSFAKVKEALHIPTGERVAVKIIDKKKSREDSYVRKNLRREGKILQMIRHHNVVQLLEIMETQNSYYLVTELCRGGDLMDYISQRRKLPEPEVKKYIRQIVSAVDYLHRLGILHRDLKIENLLLDEFKDMKIIDFGLSNCVKVVQTKDGPKVQEFCVTQCGSPAYAAPELLGRKKYGPQVDIWSIGVNMYAMLTGNLPFTVEPFNIKALHSKMTNGQMNPLPDGISRECRDIIKKFLNPDPDKRISVEDTLKHPWIAEGPGIPLNRAPCPNKIKTESLDNSILKHMSENQGFRVGEIIRYVTGNVPSSATAMYHLVLRKLIKHCGNLRASGKIAADHRMLNRTQHVTTTMIRKNDNVSKTGSSQPASHHYSSAARPLVNHTANSVRNTVNTQNKARDHALKTDAAENNNINNNNMYNNDNEAETERQEDTDEAFLDILQTKGTNGAINIPRANSPTKMKKDQNGNRTSVPTHLPSVAGKYVLSNRGKTTGNGISSQPIDNKTDAKKVEKLSATETRDTEEEPFRKRASTFPGKMQRPKLTINRFNKDENDNKERCESVAATRVTKSKHETVQSENAGNMTQINNLTNAPSSPKNRRNNVLSQDVPHSSTPRSNGSNVYQNKKQTNGHRRLINVNQIQKVNDKDEELQIGSHNMDELVPSTAKHMLSRASRNNRIQRTRPDNNTLYGTTKEDTIVVEHISEISSSSTRPLSSRNTNISMSSSTRPVTSTLPSLSPQNSDYSKRTS